MNKNRLVAVIAMFFLALVISLEVNIAIAAIESISNYSAFVPENVKSNIVGTNGMLINTYIKAADGTKSRLYYTRAPVENYYVGFNIYSSLQDNYVYLANVLSVMHNRTVPTTYDTFLGYYYKPYALVNEYTVYAVYLVYLVTSIPVNDVYFTSQVVYVHTDESYNAFGGSYNITYKQVTDTIFLSKRVYYVSIISKNEEITVDKLFDLYIINARPTIQQETYYLTIYSVTVKFPTIIREGFVSGFLLSNSFKIIFKQEFNKVYIAAKYVPITLYLDAAVPIYSNNINVINYKELNEDAYGITTINAYTLDDKVYIISNILSGFIVEIVLSDKGAIVFKFGETVRGEIIIYYGLTKTLKQAFRISSDSFTIEAWMLDSNKELRTYVNGTYYTLVHLVLFRLDKSTYVRFAVYSDNLLFSKVANRYHWPLINSVDSLLLEQVNEYTMMHALQYNATKALIVPLGEYVFINPNVFVPLFDFTSIYLCIADKNTLALNARLIDRGLYYTLSSKGFVSFPLHLIALNEYILILKYKGLFAVPFAVYEQINGISLRLMDIYADQYNIYLSTLYAAIYDILGALHINATIHVEVVFVNSTYNIISKNTYTLSTENPQTVSVDIPTNAYAAYVYTSYYTIIDGVRYSGYTNLGFFIATSSVFSYDTDQAVYSSTSRQEYTTYKTAPATYIGSIYLSMDILKFHSIIVQQAQEDSSLTLMYATLPLYDVYVYKRKADVNFTLIDSWTNVYPHFLYNVQEYTIYLSVIDDRGNIYYKKYNLIDNIINASLVTLMSVSYPSTIYILNKLVYSKTDIITAHLSAEAIRASLLEISGKYLAYVFAVIASVFIIAVAYLLTSIILIPSQMLIAILKGENPMDAIEKAKNTLTETISILSIFFNALVGAFLAIVHALEQIGKIFGAVVDALEGAVGKVKDTASKIKNGAKSIYNKLKSLF